MDLSLQWKWNCTTEEGGEIHQKNLEFLNQQLKDNIFSATGKYKKESKERDCKGKSHTSLMRTFPSEEHRHYDN